MSSDSSTSNILDDSWGLAAVTAAVSLVPPRSFPRWLRRGLICAPSVILAGSFGYVAGRPEATAQVAQKLGEAYGPNEEQPERFSAAEDGPSGSAAPEYQTPALSAEAEAALRGHAVENASTESFQLGRGVIGALGGAALGLLPAGLTALSFWGDEKIERGLRRLKVPAPRIVMALSAGAFSFWSNENEKKRSSAQRNVRLTAHS